MGWDSEVWIGARRTALDEPAYFIADIAANHDGELARARELIWRAKEAGADCAKFQHFLAGKIVSGPGFDELGAQVAHQSGWKKSVVEVYDQYHTRRDWTDALVETCREAGIDYMTTPYDAEALDSQLPHVPAIKIGSGDITFDPLVSRAAASGKPLLLATGAADLADVEHAVGQVLAHTRQLVLMQCNTNYSGAEENFRSVNLRVLQSFAQRWPDMVLGFSDHTPGHAAVLGAVTLGARVIEKHFTDDNAREGPDHGFAMNPRTWREMVQAVRQLEAALGDGVKRVEANEGETVVVQRRALRLRAPLPTGHRLAPEDLEALRPCPPDAVDPRRLDAVVGRTLKAAKAAGDALRWTDLA
ncbi:N-acetylneuraminate synthase family protein [Phenylobacterium sp. LjRoot219]|uniref:N-acetylneuraminate synthase family protein n=1 Tax=Phenylobacterium sp. LjRoot219 TaxID=3342283 RepID=UPI003ED0F3DC